MKIDKVCNIIKLFNYDSYFKIILVLEKSGEIELTLSQKQLDNLRKNIYSNHITYIVFDDINKRFIWSNIDNYDFLEKTFKGELIESNMQKKNETQIDNYPNIILSTKTKPLHFQSIISKLAINSKNNQFGFFMEQGLGKTKTSLDAGVYLLKEKKIDLILVYAPASLCTNWEHEINTHVFKKYHKQILIESNSVLSRINSKQELKKEPLFFKHFNKIKEGRCLLIFDECHSFKNPSSNRTKFILDNVNGNVKCFLLSGTPAPKGFIDLYTYLYMLNIEQRNYYQFQNHFFKLEKTKYGMKIIEEYTKFTSDTMALLKEKSVWVKKDDVLDLPEKNYLKFYYSLNTQQEKLISLFFKEDVVDNPLINNNEKENLEKFLKNQKERKDSAASFGFSEKDLNDVFIRLLQIQNGFYLDKEKKQIKIKENNKLNLLDEIIESISDSEPIIIFCSFTFEAEAIQEHLINKGFDVIIRHGKLTKKKKNEAINNFKENQGRILVATAASTGTGFTLINSNNIIYYSNLFGATLRLQSEDRIHRIGQTKVCNYYDLMCEGTIDEIIYLFNKKYTKVQNKLYLNNKRDEIGK